MIDEVADDKVFRALGAPVRRALMDALRERPQTTGELCARFPEVNRCTLMQHLGVLEDAGIVVVRRQGRLRWNHLDALPIKRIHDRWIGDYAAHAVDLIDRLKLELEGEERPVG
ncbi:helix-turn-helix domain-containing protein [Pseudooceanicola sp. 216_PA32_1]|uniref:Helix-turn-helix domain-containing protein n=1 Tax=Pseudooceanicola pacificus TaxID=2676438 RepID=A0A844W912_9RHOB|nr:helix-turn-helix domain-containing protein [Pseudooceanicola pacificus]MWB79401.1 helix-turn-helix domain-containing protein [Pseudooceanicola pacificus]